MQEAAAPELIQGHRLIGATVLDAGSQPLGSVRDFFLEPTDGRILAVEVVGPDPPGTARVLHGNSLEWSLGEQGIEGRAKADALYPGPLGELDYEALFGGRRGETLSGEIVAIEYLRLDPSSPAILKLHDASNLLHRVLIGSFGVVNVCLPGLAVGAPLVLDALPARDENGKLWVATRITRAGSELRLLTRDGVVLREALAARLPSASALGKVKLRLASGEVVPVQGWLIDWRQGRAVSMLLTLDGVLRSLPWTRVQVVAGAPWKVLDDPTGQSAPDPEPQGSPGDAIQGI